MSSDSWCADETSRCSVTKIFEIEECLVGVAGVYSECMTFVTWLRDMEEEPPELTNTYALLLKPDGIWMFDCSHVPYKVEDDFAAIGSGCQAALAAMHCGRGTKGAVRIATKVDPHTGGKIITKRLEPPQLQE